MNTEQLSDKEVLDQLLRIAPLLWNAYWNVYRANGTDSYEVKRYYLFKVYSCELPEPKT